MADEDQEKPRSMAAGRVLAAGLLGLCLAAVLNSGALLRDAEGQPFGPGRDRAVSLWSAVDRVSAALSMDRFRDWADEALGRDFGDDPVEVVTAPPTTAVAPTTSAESEPGPTSQGPAETTTSLATTTTTSTTMPPRVPTAEDPLRIWIGGDSMAQVFGESLTRIAAAEPWAAPVLDYQISTGLSRPDYFDWPARFAEVLRDQDPEVLVVIFGANDAQGLAVDGQVFQTLEPGWIDEYRARVEAVMAQLSAGGRRVIWVGQPVMRPGGFSQRMAGLNEIYTAAAQGFENVEFFATWDMFAGPDGGYSEFITLGDGRVIDARQGDGIHMTREGGDLLAGAIWERIAAELG